MAKTLEITTPRISILKISYPFDSEQQNSMNIDIFFKKICSQLKQRHGKYLHVFNFTAFSMDMIGDLTLCSTSFKWRGIPISLTETIKVLSRLDAYLRCNIANSVVFIAPDESCKTFCKFIIQSYCHLLNYEQKNVCIPHKLLNYTKYDNLLTEFMEIYSECKVASPPTKIIQSISFEDSVQQPFIPLFEIYSQFRHNTFQLVYKHQIQNQLTNYYLQLKAPLKSGTGSKYCQRKPQTQFLLNPCLVSGDVKIIFYSYQKLVKKPEFIVGFNTKGLQCDQSIIAINQCDWYYLDENEGQKYKKAILKITLGDYCKQCLNESKCQRCVQEIKKISTRYQETQVDLQKIKRKRTKNQIHTLLSL